jgi:LPS export ABC transporter protein LptC
MQSIKIISIIFLSFLCLILSSGCGKKEEKLPTTHDTISVPFQEMDHTVMFFYDKGVKRWKLEAAKMRKDLDVNAKTLVSPVRLTLYDSLGETGTKVIADSGSTMGSMDNFTVWGNVLVKTESKMIIRSQKLWWNKITHKVNSDTYVQILNSKGDIFRGKGLDAWEDFSLWSFKSNVTGVFPNFKERMEKDEDFM